MEHSSIRIFVVEDQKLIVADLEHTLRKLGYLPVGNADSGEDALEKIGATPCDIVLMDISLTGPMDGVEAASLIRSRFNIPVIFITAFGDEHTIARAREATPYGFVIKPFHERELRAVIEISVFRHAMERNQGASPQIAAYSLEAFVHLFRDLQRDIANRDELIAIATHELSNPIASLQLLGELISTKFETYAREDADLHHCLHLMNQQVAQITALVKNLLESTRISAGQLTLDKTLVNIGEISRKVAEQYSPLAQRAGSVITVKSSRPVKGWWDPLRLEQVLGNLLSNALKFGAGSPIEIEVASEDENYAQLTVTDYGIGIPESTIKKIFNRYERGESSGVGLGLGLYIVNEIVKAHGGTVTVESQIRQYSKFILKLPRSSSNSSNRGTLN